MQNLKCRCGMRCAQTNQSTKHRCVQRDTPTCHTACISLTLIALAAAQALEVLGGRGGVCRRHFQPLCCCHPCLPQALGEELVRQAREGEQNTCGQGEWYGGLMIRPQGVRTGHGESREWGGAGGGKRDESLQGCSMWDHVRKEWPRGTWGKRKEQR